MDVKRYLTTLASLDLARLFIDTKVVNIMSTPSIFLLRLACTTADLIPYPFELEDKAQLFSPPGRIQVPVPALLVTTFLSYTCLMFHLSKIHDNNNNNGSKNLVF